MLAVIPSLPTVGVPLRVPVPALKLAQAGLCVMEKVTPAALGDTVGWNEYGVPAVTCVGGDPCKTSGAVVDEEPSPGVFATVPGPEQPAKINATTSRPANPGRAVIFVSIIHDLR
jgi:hypothetical protein